MTQAPAPAADAESTSKPAADLQFSPTKMAGAAMIAGTLALLVFGLFVALAPVQWGFSVEVETEVAEIGFQPKTETRWRIDGAVICARGALALPDQSRLPNSSAVCGGRAWRGWQINSPEQVVLIRGGASAVLEAAGQGVAISLRTEEHDSLGTLSVVGQFDGVEVGKALNLIWSAENTARMTFPFSGTTTLGRAVSWSDPRMLHSGTVAVYTSDESADQRTLVDDAALMLGDQVRLGAGSKTVWPKGFIKVADGASRMQVVAFGRADTLRIERFGDSGYDFQPDYLTKLASDPWIAFWGSLLLVCITLIPGLLPFTEGDPVDPQLVPARYRLIRLLLRRRKV